MAKKKNNTKKEVKNTTKNATVKVENNEKSTKKVNKDTKISSEVKLDTKLSKNKSIDNQDLDLSPEMKKGLWTAVIVLIVLVVFYIISVYATGGSLFNFKSKEEDSEVEIQYSEILLGRSFDMGGEYYVVYYDASDTENEDINNIVSAVSSARNSSSDIKIYNCDLGNAFNKPFVTVNDPNTNPISADELLVNNPTIIKFSDGSVVDYIYGFNEVQDYLSNLS